MSIPRDYGSASGGDRRCRSVGRLYGSIRNMMLSRQRFDEIEIYLAV